MVRMMLLPGHAPMPALLHLLAGAEEFSGICLRRGEKKALNAINKDAGCVRFFVHEDGKPAKPRERIKTAAEKIFILVRRCWQTVWTPVKYSSLVPMLHIVAGCCFACCCNAYACPLNESPSSFRLAASTC